MKPPKYELVANETDGMICITYNAAKGGQWQLHVDESHILTEAIQQNTGIHTFKIGHWSGECRFNKYIV
jgi:hypothetical protein